VKQGLGSQLGITVLESIKNWVLSWTNDVESPEELQILYELLMFFLEKHEFMCYFDDCFPADVKMFLLIKVWPHHEKFAYYHFMSQCHFGMRTTNQSEIEGRVLKHHGAGPKPNHSLTKSADSVIKVLDLRITIKEQKAAKAMDSMPTVTEPSLTPLYSFVTYYCANTVCNVWNHQLNLTFYCESMDTFYVKGKSYLLPHQKPNPSNHTEYEKHLRP
jgi:hypothetical protein